MSILYGVVFIILIILTVIFRTKKKWRNTFLAAIAICYGGPILVIAAMNLRILLIESTDLAEIQIEGYKIGQRIEDFSSLEKTNHIVEDETILYHVVGKDYIYIAVGAEDKTVQFIEVLPDFEKVNYELENLVFGESSLIDVERIFGKKYSKALWSDMFETKINYYDKKNDLALILGFTEEKLSGLIIEKR